MTANVRLRFGVGGGIPAGEPGWRICARCVMDTTDPDIVFDGDGVCHHCHKWDAWVATRPDAEARAVSLDQLANRIRSESAGREFGCVIGLSGGVDSTMVAWHAVQLGLRPLAVHLDNGWNSEPAVWNIEQACRRLGIPLVTRVIEWEPYRRLLLAFVRAGVIDADVPADHAIIASVYRAAARHRVRWILSGTNQETELVLPHAWVWPKTDLIHLRSVARAVDPSLRVDARWYPTLSTVQRAALSRARVKWVSLLDLTGHDKAAAKKLMEDELGWRDYGGKHHESVWTRWYQATYLPRRFRVDKRRAHLASLVLSEQIDRADALAELEEPPLPVDQTTIDTWYVARKLGVSEDELEHLLDTPGVPHARFASERRFLDPLRPVARRLGVDVF